MTAGPDGNLWMTEDQGANKIVQLTTSGVFTVFTVATFVNAGSLFITTGPDGALWFTDQFFKIGRITTSGTITEYPLPVSTDSPYAIAAGPDGALWYTDSLGQVGRITTAGSFTAQFPTQNGGPGAITAGPDGAMWFTDINKIGRLAIPGFTTGSGTCTYALDAGGAAFPAAGGNGAVNVTTTAGCAWTTNGAPSGVTVTSGSGTGSGIATYTVAPNSGSRHVRHTHHRGTDFTPSNKQGTVSGTLSFIGSMPHIAAEENWTSAVYAGE